MSMLHQRFAFCGNSEVYLNILRLVFEKPSEKNDVFIKVLSNQVKSKTTHLFPGTTSYFAPANSSPPALLTACVFPATPTTQCRGFLISSGQCLHFGVRARGLQFPFPSFTIHLKSTAAKLQRRRTLLYIKLLS